MTSSGGELAELLRGLAEGKLLAEAAAAAGYGSAGAAADALFDLAERPLKVKPVKRKKDPATALPPEPPEDSPYSPGDVAVMRADGASRGNPGPASYGCVYLTADGVALCGEGDTIGRATNNVAEYSGLLAGLRRLQDWGVEHVIVELDSQLAVKQMNGEYRVKNEALKPLFLRARSLASRFESCKLRHIERAKNSVADALANAALDAEG